MEDNRLQSFGFAKLLGVRGEERVEYIVKTFDVILGRNSKSNGCDVVLGESMSISRKHARIMYNFETRTFQLTVMGKNGVHVGDVQVLPDDPPRELKSGDCIITSDSELYFLLPQAQHPYNSRTPGTEAAPSMTEPTSDATAMASAHVAAAMSNAAAPNIAPLMPAAPAMLNAAALNAAMPAHTQAVATPVGAQFGAAQSPSPHIPGSSEARAGMHRIPDDVMMADVSPGIQTGMAGVSEVPASTTLNASGRA